jgi:hypothetical protein
LVENKHYFFNAKAQRRKERKGKTEFNFWMCAEFPIMAECGRPGRGNEKNSSGSKFAKRLCWTTSLRSGTGALHRRIGKSGQCPIPGVFAPLRLCVKFFIVSCSS